jgi:hypothetical protein
MAARAMIAALPSRPPCLSTIPAAMFPIGALTVRPPMTTAPPVKDVITAARIIEVVVPSAIVAWISGRAIIGIIIIAVAAIADTDVHTTIAAISRAAAEGNQPCEAGGHQAGGQSFPFRSHDPSPSFMS